MIRSDVKLLARAGAELAVLLELKTGYPDSPKRMVETDREAVAVVTNIFLRLVEENASVPAPVAHLVAHLQRVTNLFEANP